MERKIRAISEHFEPAYVPRGVFRHRYNPPIEVKYEDLFEPSFWDALSDKFRVTTPSHQGQVVEVFPHSGEYFAELLGIKLSNGQVRMEELWRRDLKKTAESVQENKASIKDKFEVKLRGPRKWSVLEKSTGKVLFENLATQDEANEMMQAHIEELVA